MEKDKIGAILKARIKEKGYTQEQFADEVGIGFSSLKKYIRGENAYNYEIMELFAQKLECSYDYLLGLSKSPIKEHHEIAEQTRLSENAISKIIKYAKLYDEEFEARRMIKCLDELICDETAFENICDYLLASKPLNMMSNLIANVMENAVNNNAVLKEIGVDRKLPLEQEQMIKVVCSLKDIKERLSPEFISEIRELETEKECLAAIDKMREMLPQIIVQNVVTGEQRKTGRQEE